MKIEWEFSYERPPWLFGGPTIVLMDGTPCWCDPETFDYTGHTMGCLVRRLWASISHGRRH